MPLLRESEPETALSILAWESSAESSQCMRQDEKLCNNTTFYGESIYIYIYI